VGAFTLDYASYVYTNGVLRQNMPKEQKKSTKARPKTQASKNTLSQYPGFARAKKSIPKAVVKVILARQTSPAPDLDYRTMMAASLTASVPMLSASLYRKTSTGTCQ
jgi:hypothetical protein